MGMGTIVPAVRAYVNGRSGYTTTSVVYGRKELTKQTNQGGGQGNRVVFCPPESAGATWTDLFNKGPSQPKGAGPTATGPGRPLVTLEQPYEVHCWGYDATDPSEQAQDDAALALVGTVVAALRAGTQGGHGAFRLTGGRFTTTPTELRFGAEYTFTYVLQIAVRDATKAVVTPTEFDTTASAVFPDDSHTDTAFTVPPP